ncbi:MAG: hypothetical protein DHS20C07_24940 [Methyloligella sp.]|nr:MAG: hypothetical protein DHS20C07_24940 [Methyloligella sp.]
MNRHFLMTIVLVGTFVLPANAYAKKQQDGSYKPKNAIEKAEKKKKRKNKKKNAGKKNKKNKAVAKKNKPNKEKKQQQNARKRHHAPAPHVHNKRKKKKNAKIKKFFKKTLKLLAEEAYSPNNYRAPKRHARNYGYNDRPHRFSKHNRHCVPKHRVFRKLKNNGWRRIRLINQGPNRARLFASNHYGDRYKLVVHKCSGRLIKRIPLDY